MSGAVFATVESANIVGYQETTPEFESGYSFIIPTFSGVGKGQKLNIQDIKLIGAAGDGSAEIITVYGSNARATTTTYTYIHADQGVAADGWYDYVTWEPIDIDLDAGSGLWANLMTKDVKVQYSGEVNTGSITNELGLGYNMVGNSSPVPVDLFNIKLVDATGDGSAEIITVYGNNARATTTTYTYIHADQGVDKDGWYDYVTWEPIHLMLQPGQGFYLNSMSKAGVKMVIPAPL